MTKREIASLTIKLMGVFILLKTITYMPMAFSSVFCMIRSGNGTGILQTVFLVMLSIGMAVIPLAFSILVIALSDKAAAWLIKTDNTVEATGDSMTKGDVMTVAVSCIGLYFIVSAAPAMLQALMNNAIQMRQQMGVPFVSPSRMMHLFRNLIAPAVQLGLGIWLFAGSNGIFKLWKKIRS